MSISLWVINNRIGMSKDKMVSKAYDRIIDKMGTLIGQECQWTSKSCKDMFVQKFDNYYNNVGMKYSCFYPFSCIVSGHQNVSIALEFVCKFNTTNKI
jgi:hypothetical protein